jgi:protein SCO1/2
MMGKRQRLVLVGLLLMLTACQSPRRYPLRGVILAVDAPQHEITIKHEDIPGLMPAMTMVYKVKDDEVLKRLRIGEQIQAELVIQHRTGRLEKIVPVNK